MTEILNPSVCSEINQESKSANTVAATASALCWVGSSQSGGELGGKWDTIIPSVGPPVSPGAGGSGQFDSAVLQKGAGETELESLTFSCDLPAPRKQPSAVRLLGEVRVGLGIAAPARPVPTVILSAAQEEDLKAEILRTWKHIEQSEKALAPLLYKLCTALHAPGQAGKGFEAWLKKHHKPKVTAYRWIKKYAEREGLPLPYKRSKNGSKGKSSSATGGAASSFHMERRLGPPAQSDQGQAKQPDVTFIPVPKSLYEFKELYDRYLEGLSEADRHARTFEFISWLKAKFSSVANDDLMQDSPLFINTEQDLEGGAWNAGRLDPQNLPPPAAIPGRKDC